MSLISKCKSGKRNDYIDVILYCMNLEEQYNFVEFKQDRCVLFRHELTGIEKYIIEMDNNDVICVQITIDKKRSITFITPNTICHVICYGPIGLKNNIFIELDKCEILYHFHMNLHHYPVITDFDPDIEEFEIVPSNHKYIRFGKLDNDVIYLRTNEDNNYEWKFYINHQRVNINLILNFIFC